MAARRERTETGIQEEVTIRGEGIDLPGSLVVPANARGVVIFAHGSGSSRLSPRNQQVAGELNGERIGTLLFDLLTEEESLDRGNVFDIELLSSRLGLAAEWLERQPAAKGLPIGFFGASTGAAAALWAAADMKDRVSAVVSRGGRPDLAIPRLREVTAPTLLIVGGWDEQVVEMNREAMEYLPSSAKLVIIPEATHLFEEPGKLERVAREAARWFTKHLTPESLRKAA